MDWNTLLSGSTSFPAGGFEEAIVKVVHVPGVFFSPHPVILFSLAAFGAPGLGRLCPWRVRDPVDDHVREGKGEWYALFR